MTGSAHVWVANIMGLLAVEQRLAGVPAVLRRRLALNTKDHPTAMRALAEKPYSVLRQLVGPEYHVSYMCDASIG